MNRPWPLALVATSLIVVACATISETGEQRFILTTPSQEAEMGFTAFNDLKQSMKVSNDRVAIAQVQRVANRLIPHVKVPHAQWEVLVFDDPSPNAFALPGGKIGVHTGILPITKNDAGLAAVMGHELAHITLRHGGQRVSRQLAIQMGVTALDIGLASNQENYPQYRPQILAGLGVGTSIGLVLPFSRDNEYEADRIGMRYMARAGYDPREAVELWKRMKDHSSKHGGKPPEFLSTHPADSNRIAQLERYLPEALAEYQGSAQ
jgi:predicted Zn-dependent protease